MILDPRPRHGRHISLLLVPLVLAAACTDRPQAETKGPEAPVAVTTAPVTEQLVELTIPALGALAARDDATLSVKVPGRILAISVDLGSRVREGDVVAEVEPQDYELQLTQAEAMLSQARARLGLPRDGDEDDIQPSETSIVKEAQTILDDAQRNRDRMKTLINDGAVSESEQDAAQLAYDVASNRYRDAVEEANNRLAQLVQRRVEVAIARKRLADTAIRAPFDGAVQQRIASIGEYLAAGSPVVTVVRIDPLRLRAEVPEASATAVHEGLALRITIQGDPRVHSGTITRVSPGIRRTDLMLVVEADVPNDGSLRPGSFARAEIIVRDDDRVLAVPPNAIRTFAGIEKVFVVENDIAVEKPVTSGRRGEGWVEIVSGVKVGERVILDPGGLRAGQAVTASGGS